MKGRCFLLILGLSLFWIPPQANAQTVPDAYPETRLENDPVPEGGGKAPECDGEWPATTDCIFQCVEDATIFVMGTAEGENSSVTVTAYCGPQKAEEEIVSCSGSASCSSRSDPIDFETTRGRCHVEGVGGGTFSCRSEIGKANE